MADANAFLIYQDDNGVSNVNARFEGEDVWRRNSCSKLLGSGDLPQGDDII